jgi:hypothetical protein
MIKLYFARSFLRYQAVNFLGLSARTLGFSAIILIALQRRSAIITPEARRNLTRKT